MIKILNDKRLLIAVIILQTLTLLAVYISWNIRTNNLRAAEVLAEATQEDNSEYIECLSKPVSEREVCARAIGKKLAGSLTIMDTSEKVRNCMKLRPVFYRFCLEELRQSP